MAQTKLPRRIALPSFLPPSRARSFTPRALCGATAPAPEPADKARQAPGAERLAKSSRALCGTAAGAVPDLAAKPTPPDGCVALATNIETPVLGWGGGTDPHGLI